MALIDKSTFPRDKICGDALSPDVVSQLHKLPLETGKFFQNLEAKITCKAVRFISPNYSIADLSLNRTEITGYVSPRLAFDEFMFNQAQKSDCVTTFMGSAVQSLETRASKTEICLDNGMVISASMIVAADGANSVVARHFLHQDIDRNHHCAGLRVYYENVSGFSDTNAVELHFYKELLPGYFWMFPLPGNRANIGLGMLSAHVAKRKPNLKKLLQEIIDHHPNVKHRFAKARPLEEIKGFGLPLGSKKRTLSGKGFLLTGDAASLINPLSGEGIANAIRSGRVAADHMKMAFAKKDFSASFNTAYDKEIYHRMWSELQLNYWIQLAMRQPRLCNFFVKRAIGNASVQEMVLSGFNIDGIRTRLKSPGFYLNLLKTNSK